MRALPLVLLVAACNPSNAYENIGEACVGEVEPFASTDDTGAALRIDDGDTLPITVVLSTCTSGSVEWFDQSCVTTGSGTRIEVATSGRTKSPRSLTTDCRWVDQTCADVDFTSGDWTLAYGGREVAFTVPYAGPPVCTGPLR
jgi:hypothetical protein